MSYHRLYYYKGNPESPRSPTPPGVAIAHDAVMDASRRGDQHGRPASPVLRRRSAVALRGTRSSTHQGSCARCALPRGCRRCGSTRSPRSGRCPRRDHPEPDALDMADRLRRISAERFADPVRRRHPHRNPAVAHRRRGHSCWLLAEQIANRAPTRWASARLAACASNTSNFYTTAEEIGYGEAAPRDAGGAHYVIDGRATAPARHRRAHRTGVHLQRTGLRSAPTTNTAGAHADAHFGSSARGVRRIV